MRIGTRIVGTRLGVSLMALTVAIPVMPATITPAGAQNLLDGLFRAPARRKRELRNKRLRQRKAQRRTVRRKRAAQRQAPRVTKKQRTASKKTRRAATKKVAKRQKKRTQQRRVAAVKTIKAPTFKNYKAENVVTVDIASAAGIAAAATAAERLMLMSAPNIRQLPEPLGGEREASAGDAFDRAMGAKALFAPGESVAEGAADEVRIVWRRPADAGEKLPVVEVASGTLDRINRVADLATELDVLDRPPRFERLARDPRVDQLAAREAAWRAMGQQTERATGPVANVVAQHYATTREFLWTDGRRIEPAVRDVIRVLREADLYGLDAGDYVVPRVPRTGASLDEVMAFELALTTAVAEYMRDAAIGRIVADNISGYHDLPRRNPELEKRLKAIATSTDPVGVLLDAHPDNREFDLIQAKLAGLLRADEKPLPVLPKTTLRAGRSNPHAADAMELLRHRASKDLLTEHAEALALYDGGEAIPAELDGFLRGVQKQYGLSADGIIGPRSIAKLNPQSQKSRIDRLVLTLERLRWLPEELGSEHVMINQPAYRVQHMVDGDVNLSMRVVVGKRSNQTNFFYDKISHIEFNPDWAVPRSIVVNEYLPRLQRDPGYLDRLGYEVRDARGRKVSSSRVNWGKYSNPPFSVRQPPSSNGALGELKIDFPNRHAIYMHDTPAKSLFNRAERAYSHGCVRLHDPRAMAAAMLGTDKDDVKRRIRKGHHTAKITRDIPVYISYFTAWPNDEGEIGYYGDIYGRDKALMTALEKTRAERAAI